MIDLPSKYSSQGLSVEDQQRVITTGTPRKNQPIGALKIEERVNDAYEHQQRFKRHENEDEEGDIPMIGIDDEDEIQMITGYVDENRFRLWQTKFENHNNRELGHDQIESQLIQTHIKETIMVVDTNFVLSHLDILDELSKLSNVYHHKIIIPNAVLKELDGLKNSKRTFDSSTDGTTIGYLARWANDWIYAKLSQLENSVKGQKLREVIDRNTIKDDSILDCCLYFKSTNKSLVVLLTDDKNLCLKALTNEVLTISYRKGMTGELISQKCFEENKQLLNHVDSTITLEDKHEQGQYTQEDYSIELDVASPIEYETPEVSTPVQPKSQTTSHHVTNEYLIKISDFDKASSLIFKETTQLVNDAVNRCMIEEYDSDLDLVDYHKDQLTDLYAASLVMIKFWVSVFTEYFQNSPQRPFIDKNDHSFRKRQTPIFVYTPGSLDGLVEFIRYWSEVLQALYVKRDEVQNNALDKIIERWIFISKNIHG